MRLVSWHLESTPLLKEKVFTAHSLLPEDDKGAVVSVLNLGDRAYSLYQNRLLGVAGEAICLGTLVEGVSLRGEHDDITGVPLSVLEGECAADMPLTQRRNVDLQSVPMQGSIAVSDVTLRCDTHDACPCGGSCADVDALSHVCTDCGYTMLGRNPNLCLSVRSNESLRACENPVTVGSRERNHTARRSRCAGKIWRRRQHVQAKYAARRQSRCNRSEASCGVTSDEADPNVTRPCRESDYAVSIRTINDALPSGTANSMHRGAEHDVCLNLVCDCREECMFLHSLPNTCIECECMYTDHCTEGVSDVSLCEIHGIVIPPGRVCGECWMEDGRDVRECAKKYCCKSHIECTDNPQVCKCHGYCDPFMDYTNVCLRCECVHTPPGSVPSDVESDTCAQSTVCERHGYIVPVGQRCKGCYDVNYTARKRVSDCASHVNCPVANCKCCSKCDFDSSEQACVNCRCDRQSALNVQKSERCEGRCMYDKSTWCSVCSNLCCDTRDCVYTEDSDLCLNCHEALFVEDESESSAVESVPLDLSQKSVCSDKACSTGSVKRVRFDAHVKGYDDIYCWEHMDSTKANECICVSVGRICVFNVWDDCCVRRGCDNKPYIESTGVVGPVSKVCAAGAAASSLKPNGILRANRVVSPCANQPVVVPDSVSVQSVSGVATAVSNVKTRPSTELAASVHARPGVQPVDMHCNDSAWVRFAVNAVYAAQGGSASVKLSEKESNRSVDCRVLSDSCTRVENGLNVRNVETSVGAGDGSECGSCASASATCAKERAVRPYVVPEPPSYADAVRILGKSGVQTRLLADSQSGCVGSSGDHARCVESPTCGAVRRGKGKNEDYEHLRVMAESLSKELSSVERYRVVDLLCEYKDVFSKSEHDLGLTHLVEGEIDVDNARLHCEPLRRHPKCYLDPMDAEVNSLLKADVIEDASSNWNFNLVVVRKKETGKIRITTDLRKLNEVCKVQFYPLPRKDDCLDALAGNDWFSTMDVSQSLHQVPLAKSSRQYCAFSTRRGSFQYKRMPMGWVNSSAVFSRLMNLILRDICYVSALCYLDDIIVYGATFEEHLDNLHLVLDRLRVAGLKLKPSKCKLLQRKIRFLLHDVSVDGIQLSDESIAPVQNWEFPTSVTGMRSLLGLTNYYRMFIKGYGSIVAPFSAMTGKGSRVEKTAAALEAFF